MILEGLIVVLDHQCRKVWSARLESPPAVLQARCSAGSVCMVVGCDDGTVLQLDQTGQVIAHGRIEGDPPTSSILPAATTRSSFSPPIQAP